MSIPDCISFLVTQLVDILSSAPVFPFVGFWLASYVLYLIISLIRRN